MSTTSEDHAYLRELAAQRRHQREELKLKHLRIVADYLGDGLGSGQIAQRLRIGRRRAQSLIAALKQAVGHV